MRSLRFASFAEQLIFLKTNNVLEVRVCWFRQKVGVHKSFNVKLLVLSFGSSIPGDPGKSGFVKSLMGALADWHGWTSTCNTVYRVSHGGASFWAGVRSMARSWRKIKSFNKTYIGCRFYLLQIRENKYIWLCIMLKAIFSVAGFFQADSAKRCICPEGRIKAEYKLHRAWTLQVPIHKECQKFVQNLCSPKCLR